MLYCMANAANANRSHIYCSLIDATQLVMRLPRGMRVVATAEFASAMSHEAIFLADLPLGMTAVVASIDAESIGEATARRLAEIGFLPGETVRVMARIAGGNPIAVRIGSSTFALRRHEALCIRIRDQQVEST